MKWIVTATKKPIKGAKTFVHGLPNLAMAMKVPREAVETECIRAEKDVLTKTSRSQDSRELPNVIK